VYRGDMAKAACPRGGGMMRGVKECTVFISRDDNSVSYVLTASPSSLMVLRNRPVSAKSCSCTLSLATSSSAISSCSLLAFTAARRCSTSRTPLSSAIMSCNRVTSTMMPHCCLARISSATERTIARISSHISKCSRVHQCPGHCAIENARAQSVTVAT
jgi:hypothetical protein